MNEINFRDKPPVPPKICANACLCSSCVAVVIGAPTNVKAHEGA